MVRIVSKKNVKPITVECDCGTIAEFNQRNEICCYGWLVGFWKPKWQFTFWVKCPTCHKDNKVSVDSMSSDVVTEKQSRVGTISLSTFDF